MNFLNNSIIGVLISIILIYALLSIIVSILVEWWNHARKSRGKMLQQAIMHMLNDKLNLEFGKLFYNHPMVSGIKYSETKRPPQYISSSMFADVLIDIISQQLTSEVKIKKTVSGNTAEFEVESVEDPQHNVSITAGIDPLSRFKKALDEKLAESPFRDMLLSLYAKAGGNYDKLKAMLETWYNDHMDRVSGWYKTKLKRKLLIAGFIVAVALNVDSIFLFRFLNLNKDLTERLVLVAEDVARNYETLLDSQKLEVNQQIGLFRNALEAEQETLVKTDVTGSLDTSKLNEYYSKFDKLAAHLDSSQQQYYANTKEVLSIVSELGLPIGWSKTSAPVSWFIKNEPKQLYVEEVQAVESGFIEYMQRRDYHPNFWDIFLYILGISITGFSLSFGAPFWFDALTKLVNIRRSGNKPSIQTVTK